MNEDKTQGIRNFQYAICVKCTYLRTELSPSCEAANCAAIQEIPSNFKEPEGSSPCSQEPSTGPYPEPEKSTRIILAALKVCRMK
jgi:hypothetical protein